MAPGLDEFDVIIRSCIVFSQSSYGVSCPEFLPIAKCLKKFTLGPKNVRSVGFPETRHFFFFLA